jgi:hypothetical protein
MPPSSGRPPNKGENASFQVSVPKRLYQYLGYLAKNSFLGVSESEVATYLLIEKARELAKTEFQGLKLPALDDPE